MSVLIILHMSFFSSTPYNHNLEDDKRLLIFAFMDKYLYEEIFKPHFFNKMKYRIACYLFNAKYIHIEACDIYGNCWTVVEDDKGVKGEPKDLDRENYRSLGVIVSKKKYDLFFAYIESLQGRKYNRLGYYYNFLATKFGLTCIIPPYDAKGERVFCSELFARALVKSRIVEKGELDPKLTTPDQIHEILSKKYGFIVIGKQDFAEIVYTTSGVTKQELDKIKSKKRGTGHESRNKKLRKSKKSRDTEGLSPVSAAYSSFSHSAEEDLEYCANSIYCSEDDYDSDSRLYEQ